VAREKKVEIMAVNITIQPHTTKKYLELFKDAFALRSEAQVQGEQYALLSHMNKVDRSDSLSPLTGDIFRFTNIDTKKKWFNSTTNQYASDKELGSVTIPENLKPNSSRFSYIFFPEEHILFYESYYDGNTLGATNAARFFENLFSNKKIIKKFGQVDITIIPESNKLSEALKMGVKEQIELSVKRPNPDDNADAEREVLERMKSRNVGLYEEKYKAVAGESIELDKELEIMAKVAAKNGAVKIKGKDDDGKPVEYSTLKHPWKGKRYYDPSVTMPISILQSVASDMKEKMKTWLF
jgi:hypothetical protein